MLRTCHMLFVNVLGMRQKKSQGYEYQLQSNLYDMNMQQIFECFIGPDYLSKHL
jgi:hypothetical protein